MLVNVSGISLDTSKHVPPQIRSWMLGQLLDASVIGRDGGNSIRLRLGGAEVRAATALPLQRGDKLTLQVTQLKPVVTLSPVAATTLPQERLVQAAMRLTLPKQLPIAPLLDHLAAASRPRASPTDNAGRPRAQFPAGVIAAAHEALQTIPSAAEVSDAARLPAVIRRLGQFFESRVRHQLLTGRTELPAQDLKWQLLRLRGELRKALGQAPARPPRPIKAVDPMPIKGTPQGAVVDHPTSTGARMHAADPAPATRAPQHPIVSHPTGIDAKSPTITGPPSDAAAIRTLQQQVDGAIAKIETNQLQAVGSLLDGDYQLIVDLPVALGDTYEVIKLKISREESTEYDAASATTTVVIELPLADDAILRAVVTLRARNMSVKLWSDNPRIRLAIAAQYDMLGEQLRANGFGDVTIALVELKPFAQWGKKFAKLVDVKA